MYTLSNELMIYNTYIS